MNIFVGNLPFVTTDDELHELFARYGEITRATVIKDRVTGKSRGFGFVEMMDDEMARQAIEALNGSDLMGRALTVNEARPRESRPRSGGGGGTATAAVAATAAAAVAVATAVVAAATVAVAAGATRPPASGAGPLDPR